MVENLFIFLHADVAYMFDLPRILIIVSLSHQIWNIEPVFG